MARRSTPKRLPSLRFQRDGRFLLADVVSLDGNVVFFRTTERLKEGSSFSADWSGAGRLTVSGRVESVADAAPDGRHGVLVRLTDVASQDGRDAVTQFVRARLDVKGALAPSAAGAGYRICFEADEPKAPVSKGPAMRVAGTTSTPAGPLVTGRPATTPEVVAATLEQLGTKIGMFLNVPCAYWVTGAQYWGRALRISERWLQVNTNAVVPGLGVKMRCDLTLVFPGESENPSDAVRHAIAVYGVLGRKVDDPPGGSFKAQLWITVQRIDEGESPGLLALWLEKAFHHRRDRGEEPEQAG